MTKALSANTSLTSTWALVPSDIVSRHFRRKWCFHWIGLSQNSRQHGQVPGLHQNFQAQQHGPPALQWNPFVDSGWNPPLSLLRSGVHPRALPQRASCQCASNHAKNVESKLCLNTTWNNKSRLYRPATLNLQVLIIWWSMTWSFAPLTAVPVHVEFAAKLTCITVRLKGISMSVTQSRDKNSNVRSVTRLTRVSDR